MGHSIDRFILAVVLGVPACLSSARPPAGDTSTSKPAAPVAASDAGTIASAASTVAPPPLEACPDPTPPIVQAEIAACPDPLPWSATAIPAVRLTVDAEATGPRWNRFYEKAVAADHARTLLCTPWGRSARGALKKGHDEAGFQYVRFHGILNDDIGIYSEGPGGEPVYHWDRFDQVYDAIAAAEMRPIVEISFTPAALASDSTKVQNILWYDRSSPNISSPRDWDRWKGLMAAIVRHLEERYGAKEVRDRWYFEVWNEPSWMYSAGLGGYPDLYENTATGLLEGDPQVKVGGPAGSAGESPALVTALLARARAKKLKLDFITYHRYGDDDGTMSDANGMVSFHRTLAELLRKARFSGEIVNDEFGPTSKPGAIRDDESSASFVAKTIHLLGTSEAFAPPTAYAYWTISDLYEEFDTGPALAYREGNYGLLLKGDPRYPESYDVAKPAFNAFRLLHRMGDLRLPATGGTTGDGVNAAATISADRNAVQVLVYQHVSGGRADATQSTWVGLTVKNLPFATRSVHVRQFVVDRRHANSHTAWVDMNKPMQPTRDEWIRLRDAAALCDYETTAAVRDRTWTGVFPQSTYGVSLIELRP